MRITSKMANDITKILLFGIYKFYVNDNIFSDTARSIEEFESRAKAKYLHDNLFHAQINTLSHKIIDIIEEAT